MKLCLQSYLFAMYFVWKKEEKVKKKGGKGKKDALFMHIILSLCWK